MYNSSKMSSSKLYYGIRGIRFKQFLTHVLTLGKLKEQYIDVLLSQEGLQLYEKVFTHSTAHSDNNYEFLEFLGDTTLNKAIAWYLFDRFPHLNCSNGVKVITRLKINLISKKSFAGFAKQLHFWDFVSADTDIRTNKMDKTLEDVFEAFFGATEFLIDKVIRHGCGYSICYNIIKAILDTTHITLKYEEIFDSKTRLKELFDYFGSDRIGTLKYTCQKNDRIHYVNAIQEYNGHEKKIGSGYAGLKNQAQQYAATQGLVYFKRKGMIKPLPEGYKEFCQ